jgi:hypothetical protein
VKPFRPDRVVRILTMLVSVMYHLAGVALVLVILVLPGARALAGDSDRFTITFTVPVITSNTVPLAQTPWGPADVELKNTEATMRLPVGRAPWWLVAAMTIGVGVGLGMTMYFLYHLRRIFQRVRDGAPFDAENAWRLRRMGLILVAYAAFWGVFYASMVSWVGGWLRGTDLAVSHGMRFDLKLIVFALILMALAEIFRRGGELEAEQSLVV